MSKFSSIFSQLLSLFSKSEFYRAVQDTNAERHARGFSSWDQFVAMLFCQLGRAHSLREICGGLQTCLGKVRHLGLEKAPSHSTLAYANEHRPHELYERVFFQFTGRRFVGLRERLNCIYCLITMAIFPALQLSQRVERTK